MVQSTLVTEHQPPVLGEPLPVELANTRFARRGGVLDGLETPGDLSDWLGRVASRLPLPLSADDLAAVGPAELAAARRLRDALRTLLACAIHGTPREPGATAALNGAVRAAPRWSELPSDAGDPVVATTGTPVAAALAAIAEEGVALLGGAAAERLRACTAPGCILFYRKDHPRRVCCSPRCSNRMRAARHYARRTAEHPGR